MIGTLFNPYNQEIGVTTFGNPSTLPQYAEYGYTIQKGNPVLGLTSPNISRIPKSSIENGTVIKAGEIKNSDSTEEESMNRVKKFINIKQPRYSSSSKALIEFKPYGVKIGGGDEHRDYIKSEKGSKRQSPREWTYGIQYYAVDSDRNRNDKTLIPPLIYPQAYRREIWQKEISPVRGVNRRDTQDITDLDMEYYCGNRCNISSASLGTPVPYRNRNSTEETYVPLPVQNSGEGIEKYNEGYTHREIGRSTRDYPQPINPIQYLQRKKAGLPVPEIGEDYDDYTLNNLRNGFVF